jgi:hypothetical protein
VEHGGAVERKPRVRSVGPTLVVLFVLGVLLLNFPVLAIFNRGATVGGLPVLYVYLFGVWIGGIVAVLLLARRPWDDTD